MKPDWTLSEDERPRNFRARIRRARSLRSTLLSAITGSGPHFGRRLTVLLAAIAVPAFASPDAWPSFEIANAGHSQAVVEPMPFERTGDSFPGSAFYYLAPEQPIAAGIHGDGDSAPDSFDPVVGPAARALRIDNSGIDRTRALQCLTAAIYYEAASEPDAGQRAVAQVVLNRVAHPSYPKSVCGVVYQGSERSTGCQFSFTCDGSLARRPMRLFWLRAEAIAAEALSGYVYAPVGLATHYHTVAVHPSWSDKLSYLGTIGAHRFYRFGGPAGQPAAFRFAYLGGEPIAAPHARGEAPDDRTTLDPIAIQNAWEAGLLTAKAASAGTVAGLTEVARPSPLPTFAVPDYSQEMRQRGGDAQFHGTKLPEPAGVRSEYANSGRWIAQPGT